MQHAQNAIERGSEDSLLRGVGSDCWLDRFEVPVAEVAPNKVVKRLGDAMKLVLSNRLVHRTRCILKSGEHPSIGQRHWLARRIWCRLREV